MSSGGGGEGVILRTRGQKRRRMMIWEFRDSLLWDVVVKNDDICFKHILAEIEFERCEILVRGEYGDEKVDEEIVSRE